jgi:hypothetical protein
MPNPSKIISVLKVIAINAVVFLLLYALIELSYSSYRYFFTDTSPESFALFEHPGETIKFDPIRGYLLTQMPSRVARVNYGKVEYMGSFRGNLQGFPDHDDFSIKRLSPGERRVAVFGDSFTAATMEPLNAPNWPNRVEDLCRARGSGPLITLNFSLDGGGLANWASILREIVVKDRYELDGLVLAVAWDDLDRKFAMFDQIDAKRFMHARAPTWDVDSQPKTEQEALALLVKDTNPANRYVLSTQQFDAFLAGQWKPKEWKFRFSSRLWQVLASRTNHTKSAPDFEPGQVKLINEIRQLAKEHSWPIAVAYIPNREELFDATASSTVEKCRKFSEMLGATFFDGREAFRGLSIQQTKNDWFPIDGHWNRGGSDQFASFMAAQIPRWLAANAEQENNRSASAFTGGDSGP